MTVQDILKTDGIITATVDEKLAPVLSNLSSSHDTAFIFDDENAFLGIINPYYAMVKTSFPPHTNIDSCLFHPPKLLLTDSLERTATLMIESKIHYLPVFDNEKFVGIATARRILSAIRDTAFFDQSIGSFLTQKTPLVTILEKDSLSHSIAIFKKSKVSKLVVISPDMKLLGILAHYDLIEYLTQPRDRQAVGSRVGEKKRTGDKLVKHFTKHRVLTLTAKHTLRKAAELILTHEIGSVIIVDGLRHPVGIITTKDLLLGLFSKKETSSFIFESVHLAEPVLAHAQRLARFLANKISDRSDIYSAKLRVSQEKRKGKREDDYTASLYIRPRAKSAKLYVIAKKGRGIEKVLKDMKRAVTDHLGKHSS